MCCTTMLLLFTSGFFSAVLGYRISLNTFWTALMSVQGRQCDYGRVLTTVEF